MRRNELFSSEVFRSASICVAVVATSGCLSLHDRGPASSELISCRHNWKQGLDAVQRGQWKQAETLFASAVESCPHDERARQYYADALWRRGAHDDAIEQMEKAVQLSGGDAQLVVGLGEMYLSVGDVEVAENCASEVLARQSDSAAAWALRGDIQWGRGQRNDALASYHRALSVRPQFPRIQFAVAQICYQQDRPQQGLVTLQQLIETTVREKVPKEVFRLEGLIYKSLGRYDDAVESFRTVVQSDRPNAQSFFELADVEFCADRYVDAHRSVYEALARDSTHEASRRLLEEIGLANQQATTKMTRLPQQVGGGQVRKRQ